MLSGENFSETLLTVMNAHARKSWLSFLGHNDVNPSKSSDSDLRYVYEKWLLFRWPIDRDKDQRALDMNREGWIHATT